MDPQVCIKNLINIVHALSKDTSMELFFTAFSKIVIKNGRQTMEIDYDLLKFQFLDTGNDNIKIFVTHIINLKQAAMMTKYNCTPETAKTMKKMLLKLAEDYENLLIVKYWPKNLVGDIWNFC